MPLLKIETVKNIQATLTLEDSIAHQVNQYAAFVNSSADVVVNRALEYLFKQDKEFQKFRDSNPDSAPIQPLRIKKPVPLPSGAKRGPKPNGGGSRLTVDSVVQ